MDDVLSIIFFYTTDIRTAASLALVRKGLLSRFLIHLSKLRKFMSKFVAKGEYAKHILKMERTRGNKLSKPDAINSAIVLYKSYSFCKFCWLDIGECYCCEEWFNYLSPHTCYQVDPYCDNVNRYFARLI